MYKKVFNSVFSHMIFFTWMHRHFTKILFIMMIAGLLLPDFMIHLMPLIKYAVLILLYSSFLKIDIKDIRTHFQQPSVILILLLISLVLFPTAVYFMTWRLWFSDQIAIWAFLITAMPAGLSSIAFCQLLGGKSSLAFCFVVLWHLLIPFTIPLLSETLFSEALSLSVWNLMWLLGLFIAVPFLLAQATKAAFPNRVETHASNITVLSTPLIIPWIAGPIAQATPYIFSHVSETIILLLYIFLIAIVWHLIARYLFSSASTSNKVAYTMNLVYINTALAVVFASEFLSPESLLVCVLYNIPWVVLLTPFKSFLLSSESRISTK